MIAIRIAAAVAVVASACTDLGDVPRDVCGNGVIEASNAEDCDGSEGCGLPDSALACRLRCDPDAAAPTCPGTAACGRDGSCHAPGGSFELATSFTWTTPHLLIADTSADGYPELIGVANQHVEVRLGGPDLGFRPLPPIPSPALSGIPQVADFEGDGDADVVLPVGAGVFSLSGHPSTVLDPFFHNSFDAPGEGRIVAGIVEFAEVILVPLIGARDPVSGMSVLTFPGDDGTSFALFPPGRSVDDVAGDILAVGTVNDGSFNLRTVALPFTTGRIIALYDVALGLDLVTVTARPAPVTLPVDTRVRHGVWFADFDGDGHVDSVASVEQGGFEGLAVAWGRGDGVLQDAGNVINQATVVWRADRDQDGDGLLDGPVAPVADRPGHRQRRHPRRRGRRRRGGRRRPLHHLLSVPRPVRPLPVARQHPGVVGRRHRRRQRRRPPRRRRLRGGPDRDRPPAQHHDHAPVQRRHRRDQRRGRAPHPRRLQRRLDRRPRLRRRRRRRALHRHPVGQLRPVPGAAAAAGVHGLDRRAGHRRRAVVGGSGRRLRLRLRSGAGDRPRGRRRGAPGRRHRLRLDRRPPVRAAAARRDRAADAVGDRHAHRRGLSHRRQRRRLRRFGGAHHHQLRPLELRRRRQRAAHLAPRPLLRRPERRPARRAGRGRPRAPGPEDGPGALAGRRRHRHAPPTRPSGCSTTAAS